MQLGKAMKDYLIEIAFRKGFEPVGMAASTGSKPFYVY